METYVYLIKQGNKKHYPMKIGVSKKPEERLKDLQTGSPYPLTIIAVFPCDSKRYAYNLEKFLHNYFFKSQLCGEWFSSKSVNFMNAMNAWNNRGEIKRKKDKL